MPSYPLMVLMLGILACIAPITIDIYLPAFGSIRQTFSLLPEQVQLTLGVYLLAYSCMTLCHGTISDSFGRKRILLISLLVYMFFSAVGALAKSFMWLLISRIGQGLTAGAGIIIGQAIINDCYTGYKAQRTMSYIIMTFSMSTAFSPIIGGYVAIYIGWRYIFWILFLIAFITLILCAWQLPETLEISNKQYFSIKRYYKNCCNILQQESFIKIALSLGSLFGGFAIIIGAAPNFITNILSLPETSFSCLFIPLVIGLLSGSFLSNKLINFYSKRFIIRISYIIMILSCIMNLIYIRTTKTPELPWIVIPFGFFSFGLSMAIPNITTYALKIVSNLNISGMAISILNFIQMLFFSVISGWFVPLVYNNAFHFCLAITISVIISNIIWIWAMHKKI